MIISNTFGTLKTIFTSNRLYKPAYAVAFLDALIFATVIKQVASGDGFHFALAFAIGKVAGIYIAGLIDSEMALGLSEVNIFFNSKRKMAVIADSLRDAGYSVNTHITYGLKGTKRYAIQIALQKKKIKELMKTLQQKGIEKPTLTVKELVEVQGKFI